MLAEEQGFLCRDLDDSTKCSMPGDHIAKVHRANWLVPPQLLISPPLHLVRLSQTWGSFAGSPGRFQVHVPGPMHQRSPMFTLHELFHSFLPLCATPAPITQNLVAVTPR